MTEPWLLGRYEVVAELGKGAMGVVYRANDPMLNRMVAIKTINTEEAGHEGMAEYEARFYTEAKAAGGLNHPNIIIVYDIGKSGHLVYMAMEYVEGKELRELLADGKPLPVTKAVDIAAQVAEGLAYAHQHQVVHRDIKPANIMITPDGRAKIADFGIARMRSSETRTQTGVILGSPKYISPEQVVGKRADHRSDIFSLGVILYESITGSTPFNGEGLSALMYQITNHDPATPSSSNSQVPVMLDYIIAKVLAKAPEARYQSAADFAHDLRECKAQMDTGQSGAGVGLTTTSSKAIPAAPLAATQPAPPKLKESAEATTDPSPTRGISRAFDSLEATQRLLAQMGEDGTTEFVSTRSISGAGLARDRLRAGERPWGHRENVIFAATVAAALVIATAIALL